MARYLFVVPPFAGHVFPAVAVSNELASRGHELAWVSTAAVRNWLPQGSRLYEPSLDISRATADDLRERTGASWLQGLRVFWEEVMIPMSHAMLPAAETAIEDFRPTAMIVDQQALAGALAARRAGIPWATSSTTAQLHADSLDGYPRVKAWVHGLLSELQREAGVEEVEWPDRSPSLVILYTSRELVGLEKEMPTSYLFVGPAFAKRSDSTDFPWHVLAEGQRRLLVSFGSTYGKHGGHLLDTLTRAFAGDDLQVIVGASPRLFSPVPGNFIVQPWLPQLDVLARVDAVLTHAGSTVNEALAFGLPLVVAPITQDQPIFAQEAVAAGAALRVRYNRVSADELRHAVFEVMEQPSYRSSAQRIQASFKAAGGAPRAADAIEALA